VAVVSDYELNLILTLSQAQTKNPFPRLRVQRINDLVGNDLKKFAGLNLGFNSFGEIFDEMNPLFPNCSLVDTDRSFRYTYQGHFLRLLRLLRECKGLL
jgi:hypothetical protein